jgi:FeS assembly SUF system regulator
MFRMTRLADYGIVLLTHLAGDPERLPQNAKDLAARSHMPLPVVTKILKILAREGLLLSHRGTKGGYSLARGPEQISMAEVIRAVEGPIALTACVVGPPGDCQHESFCPVRGHVQKINHAIRQALGGIKLADLCASPRPIPAIQLVRLDTTG